MQSLCETSLQCHYTENWNRRKSPTVFANIIATRGGKGTVVVLEIGTTHQADTWQEQVGSVLCHSTFRGFGTCHAPPKPAAPAAHLWRAPSMSQACRNTHNCTGRLEKLSAHIHNYFRTQNYKCKVPGRWRNTTLHPKFKWSIVT